MYEVKAKALMICGFVMAYAKSRFSHDVTHMIPTLTEVLHFKYFCDPVSCLFE